MRYAAGFRAVNGYRACVFSEKTEERLSQLFDIQRGSPRPNTAQVCPNDDPTSSGITAAGLDPTTKDSKAAPGDVQEARAQEEVK